MPERLPDRRAFRIAERAFQEPGASRRRYVEDACQGDVELRRAIDALLAEEEAAGSFLEEPLVQGWEEASEQAWIGRHVGPYQILCPLGAGGTSRVYLGARDEEGPVHGVAVKLLRSNVLGPDAARRFATESRILAKLEHPGIAHFIDVGTTEQGVPYLVMEHVAGTAITAYCDARRLTVAQRLRLFLGACAAVQYAHQQLVVHRDIKPSNLFVTAEAQPKLLDFGVSKLLDMSAGDPSETTTGSRFLTPRYASPEQLAGGQVTTAADVYSLGVVLYELLAGALPRPLASSDWPEGKPRPSLGASTRPAAAAARSVSTSTLRRRLAGDLDTIVAKALRDAPQDRYASVEQLAEDVRRHLAGLPILATPPSLAYRTRKFIQRNPGAVAASIVALLALVALVVSSVVQSTRLADERDRAQVERQRAQEVTRFLVRSFEMADPGHSRGQALTAREVAELAARRASTDLASQPDLEAEILTTLGTVHRGLGMFGESAALLERARELRSRPDGATEADLGATLQALALSLGQSGDYAGAESRAREALAIHRGVDEAAVVADLGALVLALWGQRRLDEAEAAAREAIVRCRAIVGADPLLLVESQINLAVVLETDGRYDDAERVYASALATLRSRYGDDHPLLAIISNNRAWLLQEKGDFAAAEGLQREALALARQAFGERHPEVAINLNNLALLLQRRGDYPAAEALQREALAMHRSLVGEVHPSVARSLNNLALALAGQGHDEEAADLFAQSVELLRRTLGADHPEVANASANLGDVLSRLGRFEQAEDLILEALSIRRAILGDDHLDVASGCATLAKLRLATGRPLDAQRLVEEALAIYSPKLAQGHWRIAVARGVLGASLADQGELAAAEELLASSLEDIVAARGTTSPAVRWHVQRLVELFTALGKPDEAERYRSLLRG